jgi:hypothetical protein
MRHRTRTAIAATFLLASAAAFAADPQSLPWSTIPVKKVTLFYPGESTYEWLLSPAHARANTRVAEGRACTSCHEDDETRDLGDKLVKGGRLEPTPIAGKRGTVDLQVQAAHDAEYLYLRAQWTTQMNREGRMHDYVRFDGQSWKWYGHDRNDKKVRAGTEPPMYEDRFSIMLDDGKVPRFAEQGCWLTCHNGMRDTRDQPAGEVVKRHPLLGDSGLKSSDVRKYLPSTRTGPEATWDQTRSADEIARLKADGAFLDLMQWRAARSGPVGMADDGYVLEYRNFDAGKSPFSGNIDEKTMTPKFMFDPAKVGLRALQARDIGDASKPAALVREGNAVAYDPNAGWKEGDILPGRLLSRADATGSAADNDAVFGNWKDGTYTVVWRRKLNTGHADDKLLKVGGRYTIGIAVHDDNVTTRFHHVSFPLSLGIGVDADVRATTLK